MMSYILPAGALLYYLELSPADDAHDGPAQDGDEDQDTGQGHHEADVADKVDPLVVKSYKLVYFYVTFINFLFLWNIWLNM